MKQKTFFWALATLSASLGHAADVTLTPAPGEGVVIHSAPGVPGLRVAPGGVQLPGLPATPATLSDVVCHDSGGTLGRCGPTALTGPQGPKGDKGDPGDPGAVGPAGPTGPTGPAGATGATGSVGPAGPAGLNWRGPWSATVSYSARDAVEFSGSSYVAVADVSGAGASPGTSPSWSLLAARGAAAGNAFVELSPGLPQSSATLPLVNLSSAQPLGAGDNTLVSVGANGGATTLLRLADDGGFAVGGAAGSGRTPAAGAGARMMWHPGKYAFRSGLVGSFGAAYWDDLYVGQGSAAFGENPRASGANSFAAGLATTAAGSESVALGNNGTASGERSFTFNGTASGVGAVAIGSGAQAINDDALAMGPSSIAGGLGAIVVGPSTANGSYAVAIGLQNRANANFATAIGKNAWAEHQGSVVIGDGCAGFSDDSIRSTANNQFVARGCGGIKLYTNQNFTSGVEVAPGGSSWSSVSDVARKENFALVDPVDVLDRVSAMPISTWNYKAQDATIRHMGPTAQDFRAAFGLGENDTTINTIDADGAALAAIQGLHVLVRQQQAMIDQLRAELEQLKSAR